MRRAIHDGLVRPEDVLRAVAVMDVEIDDGRAGDAVLALRIARRDGGVVEKTKAHWPCRLGMVAGRPRRDEGVGGLLGQNLVDRKDRAANRAQSRLKLPGDMEVSASICTRPCWGVASRIWVT